jgi:GNAT superfamily N-acetyltransferase
MPDALASLTFRIVPTIAHKTLLAFRKDAGWRNTEATPASAQRVGGQVQWGTVVSGQKVIAIVRLELAPPQFCYVSDLIVLRDRRGCGVGGWLMAQIEGHCLALGIPRVVLQPDGDTEAFYDKLHFVADPLAAGFLKKELGPVRRSMLPF